MRLSTIISLAASAVPALADTHYFFSGFFNGSTIAGVEFDDVASTLTLVNNISTTANGSKWIHLDSEKKNLYIATAGAFLSHAVTEDLSLTQSSNISMSSDCSNPNFATSSSASPYTVFGTPYSTGCPTFAISVDESGALQTILANASYDAGSGVHGTALSPDNAFLYSADDTGNAVWVHSWDEAAGAFAEVQHLPAAEDSDPRHLAVHPNGAWVYVVYEAANSIAVYERDVATGELTFTNTTYSLRPEGDTNITYWADEVLFSLPASTTTSPKYLIASTRSRAVGSPGFVSAFSLDASTGAIAEQLFLLPTTNTGGSANAVAPASFSEEYFGITDTAGGFIEVWRITEDGAETTAAPVAHLDLEGGPANIQWYS